jgi:starch-binding outer membrane protein, SusD/RagB family
MYQYYQSTMSMKSQKITAFVFVMTLVMSLVSCQDDYFEKKPLDKLSDADVWNDLKLSELYINNIYVDLPSGFDRGWYMLASATDEAENSYDWPDSEILNAGDYTPSSYPLSGTWASSYSAIRKCNFALGRIDVVPGDEAMRNRQKGELLTLRAFFYAELVKFYGGVPIIETAAGIENIGNIASLQVSRNSYDECVDFIEKDLINAAQLLPDSYSGAEFGRITKGTALALKARVLLYAERWQAAAAAAKEVMDLGVHSLHPDYQELFLAAGNNSNEIILSKRFKQEKVVHYADLFNNSPGQNSGWGGTCPTQNFVDQYEMSNGKPITDATSGYDENNPYENRDPRFYQSILFDGAEWNGREMETRVKGADGIEGGPNQDNGDYTPTGYYLKKFMDESFIPLIQDKGSYNNWILIRYAEVLLNYAEAQNEDVGPDASVYDAVNQVRARAGMPDLPGGLTREQMRERIQNERTIELAFEEHRFWDVRRWGMGEAIFNGPVYGYRIPEDGSLPGERFVIEERTFTQKHYLFPIPQAERDRNPNLEQNDLW